MQYAIVRLHGHYIKFEYLRGIFAQKYSDTGYHRAIAMHVSEVCRTNVGTLSVLQHMCHMYDISYNLNSFRKI